MTLSSSDLQWLADDVLTFIEQREAEQIAYGIYDVTMTGAEVITGFRPLSVELDEAHRDVHIGEALQRLGEHLDILRLDDDPHAPVQAWIFRSRIAEMVRLITLVRQRIVSFDNQRPGYRLSTSKRLVADTTLTVMSRLVPRRDQSSAALLSRSLADRDDYKKVAELLTRVIEQSLPKLRQVSGFQTRAFETILRAVELDQRGGGQRGIVVTAGTGAGKTYAFFLPVLVRAMLERCFRQHIGVKAICIYPRVALSENQFSDFIEILFYLNRALEAAQLPPITIGLESGAAVYDRQELRKGFIKGDDQEKIARMRGWIFDEESDGLCAPFATCVGIPGHSCAEAETPLIVRKHDPLTLVCPSCGTRYPFIQFVRKGVMDVKPPDILIATTESLHRRMLSSTYQYLFGDRRFCAPSVVMLDEIHLQASTAGTQVALLLRRLMARIREGKIARKEGERLAFVGLSATIAQPVQFVAELTGISPEHITEVRPSDDEMQVIGAERFIFVRATESEDVATLSTLIQTTMAALHTMPQPLSESELERYRAFGFVQSLDIVGRWLYQIEDAERVRPWQIEAIDKYRAQTKDISSWNIKDIPLYAYRYPPHNRQLFPRILGQQAVPNCGCEHRHGPDPQCPLFQAGECWWVLSQNGKANQESLKIRRKSASDRDKPITPDDDLIITTSALEVGYDDDALMCVIQYGAPLNIASFVQRKGRGGRQVGTRPIVITVLSPYSAAEIFLYRNQHLLTDPVFRKLPLNTQNRFLQKIHGFYAVIDWLARDAAASGAGFDLEQLTSAGLEFLRVNGEDPSVLLALKDYIGRAFTLNGQASATLLADNDGILSRHYLQLVRRAPEQIENSDNRYGVNGRTILRDLLPENLFSDINLPETRVRYNLLQKVPSSESVSLALVTTVPGNVSFRGGFGSVWVPPIASNSSREARLNIENIYIGETLDEKASIKALPNRALYMAGIDPDQVRTIPIFRPTEITPQPFSRDHNTAYWYCEPETGTLEYHEKWNEAGQHVRQLAHSSAGYPIQAVEIRAESEDLPPAFRLRADHAVIRTDRLGERLVWQILLYSDEPNNRNTMDVRLLILGSQYTLTFHQNRVEPLESTIGFTKDARSGDPCALGYQMNTEGLALDLANLDLEHLKLPSLTAAHLRYTAARHAFMTRLIVEYKANIFAAGYLADVLLTIADTKRSADSSDTVAVAAWLRSRDQSVTQAVKLAINELYHFSMRKAEAIFKLFESPDVVDTFAEIYAEIAAQGDLYKEYLEDTFKYGLSQALKQTAQEIAGVEALHYISAYTKLHVDFGQRATNLVWLYEIGMGGIGVMRATHNSLRQEPDRFWATLAQHMTRCPTAQEEGLLLYVLSQPEEWLADCDMLAQAIRVAKSAKDRQKAIDELLIKVRQHLGIIVRQEHVKALLRIFIPDYLEQDGGKAISSWRLYRELNTLFIPACITRLGREPTFAEMRGMLYYDLTHGKENDYPMIAQLLQIYRDDYGSASEDARRAFESAMDRRSLRSCQCACPSCLNDRGGQESPQLGWMLLSRPLLAAWLEEIRASQTLDIAESNVPISLTEQIRNLFEQGSHVIYLRASAGHLDQLCKTISYLTDAGIDTNVGMVYPMITDIATLFPSDLAGPPMVEITVRPIL